MINYIDNTMGFSEQNRQRITHWSVLFMTPFGLMENRHEAVERCKSVDGDPNSLILPVAVAFSVDSYEVAGR